MTSKTFFVFLLNGAKRLIFTMNSSPRGGPVLLILASKLRSPLLAPGPRLGLVSGAFYCILADSNRSFMFGDVKFIALWDPLFPNIYSQTPDQPPSGRYVRWGT